MRILVAMILWVMAALAFTHETGISGIRIVHREADTIISVNAHRSDFVTGMANDSQVDRAVRSRLKLELDGKAFKPGKSHIINDKSSQTIVWQTVHPVPNAEFEISQRLFPENRDSRTIVSVFENGRSRMEVLLDKDNPAWRRSPEPPTGSELLGRFLMMGFSHILSGADHILFVLGLVLMGGSLASLAKTVTAFTVAHCVTLTLAVTGILSIPSMVVEPLIALSIVAIAFENLRKKEGSEAPDYRPHVGFAFGLLHGFGFAGGLSAVGLSGVQLFWSLVSFNVGVELGQAAIILVSAPVLALLSRFKQEGFAQVARYGSIGIGLAGAFWFVARILGG